jgi:hypothetical protein
MPAEWAPHASFTTAAACQTAEAEFTRDEWNRVGARNQNLPAWNTFVYRCHPDTVDPRGPKR